MPLQPVSASAMALGFLLAAAAAPGRWTPAEDLEPGADPAWPQACD